MTALAGRRRGPRRWIAGLPRPAFAELLPSGAQLRLRAGLLAATATLGAVAVLSAPGVGTAIPVGLALLAAVVAMVIPGATTAFGIVFGLGLALGNALPHHGVGLLFAAPAAGALWLVLRVAGLASALPATVEVVNGTVAQGLFDALPSALLPGLIGVSAVLAVHGTRGAHPVLRASGLFAIAVLALLPLLAQVLRDGPADET